MASDITDITDMIRADRAKDDARRERNRREMPGVAAIVDDFRAAFGSGVKVLHATEGGREIGKTQEFKGTDVDKLLRYCAWQTSRGLAP